MAATTNPKTVGFWKSIDTAFLMLATEIFEHCFLEDELIAAGRTVRFIVEQQYPKNPGQDKLIGDVAKVFHARLKEIRNFNDPELSPVIVKSDVNPTGFNSKA